MVDQISIQSGNTISWKRTFSEDEIRAFGELSGDQGVQHVSPDSSGRLMAQGLLTATLPTKIGGDINFIANELTFQFLQPVYAGDTIHCQVVLDEVEPGERWLHLTCSWTCTNQNDEMVMSGQGKGVIRKPANSEGFDKD